MLLLFYRNAVQSDADDIYDPVMLMMVLMVVLMMMIFMTLLNVDVDVATLLTTKMLST